MNEYKIIKKHNKYSLVQIYNNQLHVLYSHQLKPTVFEYKEIKGV